jgi:hypothetical protein
LPAQTKTTKAAMAGPGRGGGGGGSAIISVLVWLRKNALVSATIAAVLLGALLGSLIRLSSPSSQAS